LSLVASLTMVTGVVAPVVLLGGSAPAGASLPACGAPVASGMNSVVTCSFTGADQSWTVPTGVSQATFDAYGAQGGSYSLVAGGLGGEATGLYAVTPGTTFTIVVGGTDTGTGSCGTGPTGGFGGGGNGGTGAPCPGAGGGGGSFVLNGTTPVVVAGGGGGGSGCSGPAGYSFGGNGGGSSGTEGNNCSAGLETEPGTQSGGGSASGGATPGTSGQGGNGANSSATTEGGGGGGGGYYGGAGAAENTGGGGGSGYLDPSAITSSMNTGVQSGNGIVTITYPTSLATPTLSGGPLPTVTVLGSGMQPIDSVTLSNSGTFDGTGTILFDLYGPGDPTCSSTPSVEDTIVGINGDGPWTSGGFIPTETGTYNWTASWSGDSGNAPAATTCGQQTVTVVPPAKAVDDDGSISVTESMSPPVVTSATTATGNLLANDLGLGDDPASITSISDAADPSGVTPDTNGVISIDGSLGTLEVYTQSYDGHSAGDYGYALDPGSVPSCTGASDAFTYTLTDAYDLSSSAKLTVTVACVASTTMVYTGVGEVGTDSAFVPSATLASGVATCEASQPVSFSLSSDPFTGTVGSFPLESADSASNGTVTAKWVSTWGWHPGVYLITASYAGTATCAASSNAQVLSVTAPGQFAFGDGRYVAPNGPTSVGFEVKRTNRHGTPSYSGQLSVVTAGKWLFEAGMTGFGITSVTQGLLSGTGSLFVWTPSANHHRGGWTLVKTGVTYDAIANATTKAGAGSFGITIAYTPTAGQPTLPGYAPITLGYGGIVIR
jgi:hypothetical protein